MIKLHFAVLAHAHEQLVAELAQSLRTFYPSSCVTIFNGGKDPAFMAGRGFQINPYSAPIRYGNMTPFHFATLRWLAETGGDYDFLVTLDHDVMVLKPGLDEHLAARLGPMGYAGARLRPAPDPALWSLGGGTIDLVHRHWCRTWAPLLGLEAPWWAFNPGQVFGRELVAAMSAHDRFDEVCRRATHSRIWAIEEVILPSLAISAGADAQPLAGSDALWWSNRTASMIRHYASDPDVFLVHRIPMVVDAPERQAVRAVQNGDDVPDQLLAMEPSDEPREVLTPVWTPARWRHALDRRRTQLLATYRG